MDREIGRVISVDSFRVIIELNQDLKGLYKSGYYDLYQIAKINSYVIIPVAEDKIVAMITKVKISDETEIETSTGVISLPRSRRYIVATMTGTITGKKPEYIQGVYNFPVLDNPVWYVMEEDLKIIFDYKSKKDSEPIDFKNDYYLPIGTSPIFSDFEVKINPDKLFCKHAAILGNTGCGKSCTVATIIQSLFMNQYKMADNTIKYVNNAHFIIFDTNGEYKRAFNFSDKELKNRVNTFTINHEGLKIPYWFMNYEDFDYLFKPSASTQAPILRRAIELAKNEIEVENESGLSEIRINFLNKLLDYCRDMEKSKEFNEMLYKEFDFLKEVEVIDSNIEVDNYILVNERDGRYYYNAQPELDTSFKDQLASRIKEKLNEIYNDQSQKKIIQEQNVDIPKWFNFRQMISKYIDAAIDEQKSSYTRINEFISTLRLRLNAFYNDERFSKPFMLKNETKADLLSEFIQYILGILSYKEYDKDNDKNEESEEGVQNFFVKYKFAKKDGKYVNIYNMDNKNQITIIDMSLLPYEVLESVTGLIGRLILEFLSRLDKVGFKRGSVPTVIVLEEAQNYIPENDKNPERISISKQVFERIAREGRKFGLSLLISSQRPSELSKTILSQCNTFIVHRLQNPEDQKYIRQIVSSASEDILNQLPVLPQQVAIVIGDAVRSPVQVRMRDVDPKPDSENPEYLKIWTDDSEETVLTKEKVDRVVKEWIRAD